jgi:hypothetical protein
MTKKPTYQELEESRNYWRAFVILFICLFLIAGIIAGSIFETKYYNLQSKNQQLKSQLNNTEGKNYSCDFVGAIKPEDNRICEDEVVKEVPIEIDYHSSGKLFCEHYNGTFKDYYKTWTGDCIFIINDVEISCGLSYINNQYIWKEPCEAIQ